MTVSLLGVFATQIMAFTRSPEALTPVATITQPVSKSLSFRTILYYYASGSVGRYVYNVTPICNWNGGCALGEVYVGTVDIPEIHDQQTWLALWSQVSSNPLPRINFEARTVLLVSVPVFPFGNWEFNVTQISKTDHIQLEGIMTGPGQGCIFPALVLPPRYLVEVVEIHKTELAATLATTSVSVPC